MSVNTRAILVAGAATIALLAVGFAQLADAQSPSSQQDVLADLGNNEGIFVDAKSFRVAKGQAKGDASAAIVKLNAKEVAPGAIIFRSGDKLYLAEGRPPSTSGQAMKTFQDGWSTMMKDFQDNWATSYMK